MDAASNEPGDYQSSRMSSRGWRPPGCDRIALVLQGGGALGAYQAGVYQALHEADIEPDWVSGVSIGAINSAIIAGNSRKRRLNRLRTFWDRITDRKIWHFTPDGDVFRKARNAASSWMTMVQGQPGFCTPRNPNPWLSLAGAQSATSFYDTAPLRETLGDLVDFSLINDKVVRFSVGAVNVLSGNFIYFDNAREVIGPEHVMASGALPPALPMVKIGTDHFWDGGIVSNTPLQHLLDEDDRINTLIFGRRRGDFISVAIEPDRTNYTRGDATSTEKKTGIAHCADRDCESWRLTRHAVSLPCCLKSTAVTADTGPQSS